MRAGSKAVLRGRLRDHATGRRRDLTLSGGVDPRWPPAWAPAAATGPRKGEGGGGTSGWPTRQCRQLCVWCWSHAAVAIAPRQAAVNDRPSTASGQDVSGGGGVRLPVGRPPCPPEPRSIVGAGGRPCDPGWWPWRRPWQGHRGSVHSCDMVGHGGVRAGPPGARLAREVGDGAVMTGWARQGGWATGRW